MQRVFARTVSSSRTSTTAVKLGKAHPRATGLRAKQICRILIIRKKEKEIKMITNYQNATTEIEEIRHRVFVYASDENAGYSFEVDANGDLLKPTALIRENFAKCEAAVANGEMLDHGIEIYRNSYRIRSEEHTSELQSRGHL